MFKHSVGKTVALVSVVSGKLSSVAIREITPKTYAGTL